MCVYVSVSLSALQIIERPFSKAREKKKIWLKRFYPIYTTGSTRLESSKQKEKANRTINTNNLVLSFTFQFIATIPKRMLHYRSFTTQNCCVSKRVRRGMTHFERRKKLIFLVSQNATFCTFANTYYRMTNFLMIRIYKVFFILEIILVLSKFFSSLLFFFVFLHLASFRYDKNILIFFSYCGKFLFKKNKTLAEKLRKVAKFRFFYHSERFQFFSCTEIGQTKAVAYGS